MKLCNYGLGLDAVSKGGMIGRRCRLLALLAGNILEQFAWWSPKDEIFLLFWVVVVFLGFCWLGFWLFCAVLLYSFLCVFLFGSFVLWFGVFLVCVWLWCLVLLCVGLGGFGCFLFLMYFGGCVGLLLVLCVWGCVGFFRTCVMPVFVFGFVGWFSRVVPCVGISVCCCRIASLGCDAVVCQLGIKLGVELGES